MKQRYKITISYDGTSFLGWQCQKKGPTIQLLIQDALETLLGTRPNLTASGRTDSGVHAMGQVAHFDSEKKPSLISLNALLPKEIRILSIEEVDQEFHARYSATGKLYHYYLHVAPFHNPFTEKYALHVRKLDMDLLQKAAKEFIGKKDFTSFANEAHRGSAKNQPVKHLRKLDIIQKDDLVILAFEGDGFLYKMVRNIVGTMLEVARGKRSPKEIAAILNKKDRRAAGTSAPAKGLFLMKVFYIAS